MTNITSLCLLIQVSTDFFPLRLRSKLTDFPFDTDASNYNFDHPAALDLDLLSKHLEQIRSGHDIDGMYYRV